MSKKVDKFIEANKKSPVIEGAMLNKNKQDIGSFDEFAYMRYKLQDGQVFDLNLTERREVDHLGYVPDWGYLK